MGNVDIPPAEALYNALKVLTEDDRLANYLAINDPKAMAQANAAMTAYEAEHRVEYEVTVWVPLVAYPPEAESPEEAEAIVRAAFVTDAVDRLINDAVKDDTVFVVEQAEVRVEVRRVGEDEVLRGGF